MEQSPRTEGSKEESIQSLQEYGVAIKKEARVAGAYRATFNIESATVTLRLVFGDYSGSDVVITNMTVLPESEAGKGYGSQALATLVEWAKSNGIGDIRATQVQGHNEGFWSKNGFLKIEEGNTTGDFIHKV